ncbi:VOC family protein [Streptomyces sp. NPDC001709]
MSDTPHLAGIHHVKLPVTDLTRSRDWYRSRLGYEVDFEFTEQGATVGYVLRHPAGGPMLGLRLAPGAAKAMPDFGFFAVGVPDKAALEQLAAHLTALGEHHAGIHRATYGWVLPHLRDPDGHEVPFYTLQHHADPSSE